MIQGKRSLPHIFSPPAPSSETKFRGGVFQLPTTGNQQLDDAMRQLSDYVTQNQQTSQTVADRHAATLRDLQENGPKNMQSELSTKGSAPLNIQGLIGVPAVLARVPVANSGASANLTALQHSGSDPGPTSNAVVKYKKFQDVDGTQYFIPLFQ